MAYLVINSLSFDGLPNGTGNQARWQPTGYIPGFRKIGQTLEAADGTRNRVERNVVKRTWEIAWEKTNNATMQTLRGVAPLMTSFPFADLEGVSYTVQIEDEFVPEWQFKSPTNVDYWNVKLKLYQV